MRPMMNENLSTKDTMLFPPDGYVAVVVGVALLLEFTLPLKVLSQPSWFGVLTFIGLAFVIAGFALEMAAARQLVDNGAAVRPNDSPNILVTGGVFRWSRNPFYCGLVLVVAGAMIGFSLDWFILLVPLLWLALDRLVVPVEERRLTSFFGQGYLECGKDPALDLTATD